jgi:hypothetical protein
MLHDFGSVAGACGLFAAGKAAFDGFEATRPPQVTAIIDSVNGRPRYVPGKAEGSQRPAMGYVWRPSGGYWPPRTLTGHEPSTPQGNHRPPRVLGGYQPITAPSEAVGDSTAPGLGPRLRGGGPALLWYYQPCPGDAVMTATGCTVPDGAALGLAIATDGKDTNSGYAAELSTSSPMHLRLLRQGEVIAAEPVESTGPHTLTISRDGAWVTARCDDDGLAYDDPNPLSGDRCGAYATAEGIVLGGLTLANRGALAYSFRGVETDWQPQTGEWIVHSGMACIAWDYWLTGIGEPQAMAYNIHPQPADLHVDFGVSEYTKGFVNGDHKHYPYHDISLVTCAETRDIDSGYRYLIAGDGGRVTKLLRKGVVVAETDDYRFRISMGGHCNSPRAIQVIANQRSGELTLHLNGVPALEYTDPDPLPGGLVGIGCADCPADFRDFWMAPVTY